MHPERSEARAGDEHSETRQEEREREARTKGSEEAGVRRRRGTGQVEATLRRQAKPRLQIAVPTDLPEADLEAGVGVKASRRSRELE